MPFRTIQIDIDDAVFQAALNRATAEGKAIGELVAQFLKEYADGGQAVTAQPTTYTVQRGDTLGRIAKKFYGDPHKYPLIQQANKITDPGRIWVGQVLLIPPLPGTPSAQPSGEVTTTPPAPTTTQPVPPPPVPTAPPKPAVSEPPPPARPGEPPPKPPIQWVGSPNFNRRRKPDDISAIVIHATANSSLQGVIDWFNNPNARVSAHYTIGKDGKIVQHVRDSDRAWHAGQSVWKGRHSVNDFAIGIELVNLNDGRDPYPEEQHQANVALCAWLCHQYNISVDDIMGHVDIALPPGRKSDPRGYNLDRLRREVAARLGEPAPVR
ncbi:MAG: LysM peptidoglycan-binding domain-containing protein [Chloroflexi bacterium]|nr:MAG: LysM peptidoglycan-binding domain-containing protein [Chloroflexota bacterium]